MKKNLFLFALLLAALSVSAQNGNVRTSVSLNEGWRTAVHDTDPQAYAGFERSGYDDSAWLAVDVPHNWDNYEGFRQLRHGNRHGYAWYRKTFSVDPALRDKRIFLFFEGVGSYATVWVNGREVGKHAGGRTTFTLDITDAVRYGEPNTLAVRADHPALISDLPWVCGGCSGEWGFSEGSQPMGIFRPVTLTATDPIRIEPFGVHVWNGNDISADSAGLHFETEVRNYGARAKEVEVLTTVLDSAGRQAGLCSDPVLLRPGETETLRQELPALRNVKLWSPDEPYLYTVVTEIRDGGKVLDRTETPYGIRWVSWHLNRNDGSNQFKINGQPVLINGTCEYEHLMGNSHAFTPEQIEARVEQMRAAGFNAFRDAHQPHNLLYNKYWDELGMLWWSQMSAHIWYDTPQFRENFKRLLRDYVKERRNSPSLIMWGLQNESTLPEEYARECVDIIRELDPTTSSQRLVTTCNGGTGTDWNVVQNWSGTYGGNPDKYAEEMTAQLLNGEYGAWRSIDWHTEGDYVQNGPQSEDRMTLLMEMKVRQAESVRDKIAGQFHWLFNSHENPGRIQNGEGLRSIDRVGPVNYKGIVTPWGEPLDAFYMFRANYAPKETEPMVYIVSHTWPDRWTEPGRKDGIRVFSNCDEVELFNDADGASLGRRRREGGIGTHFIWNDADIRYNVLRAVGYVDGKPAAEDLILLHHLPQAPGLARLKEGGSRLTQPEKGYRYLYRVNCGGNDYTDGNGSRWLADRQRTEPGTWGSRSWTDDFPGVPPYFGSQRRTHDPIRNTADWELFRSFRYGTQELSWEFPVPDGEYRVELYFTEPWYGTGGGMDAAGWRLFDVAVNDSTVLENLDIWREAGHDGAVKKTVTARAEDGVLKISFPKTASGQAVLSAIAIASRNGGIAPAPASPTLTENLKGKGWEKHLWLDTGDPQYTNEAVGFASLPSSFYAAEWFSGKRENRKPVSFRLRDSADVHLFVRQGVSLPKELAGWEKSPDSVVNGRNEVFDVFTRRYAQGESFALTEQGAKTVDNVAVTYIANMGEEPSARPVVKLGAQEAAVTGAHETGNFRKGDFVKLTAPGSSLEWEVNPGLAATYLIRFRYMNRSDKPIPMRLELVNANNGVLMRSERIDFPPAPEKWRITSTSTGSMINAGLYKIRLTVLDTPGLELESMEFE